MSKTNGREKKLMTLAEPQSTPRKARKRYQANPSPYYQGVVKHLNGEMVRWLSEKNSQLITDNYLTAEDAEDAEESKKQGENKGAEYVSLAILGGA